VLLGLEEQGCDVPEELVKASTSFVGGVALSKNICGRPAPRTPGPTPFWNASASGSGRPNASI